METLRIPEKLLIQFLTVQQLIAYCAMFFSPQIQDRIIKHKFFRTVLQFSPASRHKECFQDLFFQILSVFGPFGEDWIDFKYAVVILFPNPKKIFFTNLNKTCSTIF